MRGGPGEGSRKDCCRWLIPARAGRTPPATLSTPRSSAHPRSCGADRDDPAGDVLDPGSSPLVRGGPPPRCPRNPPPGLIPARAGRTDDEDVLHVGDGAHPRSCGADAFTYSQLTDGGGSSPLVRGGPSASSSRLSRSRLIPARAGRTNRTRVGRLKSGAHPRSCGADCICIRRVWRVHGSSPLVRGGPPSVDSGRRVHGLIPARAGRTWSMTRLTISRRAHPRSCGADVMSIHPRPPIRGSSPLVRGGRYSTSNPASQARLIPARAGRTEACLSKDRGRQAHPRSCGADFNPGDFPPPSKGSSPLVRGGPLRVGLG